MSAAVDNTLHAAAGFGLAMPIAGVVAFCDMDWLAAGLLTAFIPCLWAGYGWFREQAQHRDQGWFGWWNGPRTLEGVSWGLGALVCMGVALLLKLFV